MIVESGYIEEFKKSGRPIVCSVSGGKDSTAMALYLRELGLEETNPIHYCFADTGWEHPELYEYIYDYLNPKVFNGKMVTVKSVKYPSGMKDLVVGRGMFPSRKIRMCTQELKIFPIRDHLIEIKKLHPDLEKPLNAVGIRAAESRARSTMLEFEPGTMLTRGKKGDEVCDTWRPLITAVVQDVVDIHTRHSIRPCPLYLRDRWPASRVGCSPCIMSRKSEIRALAVTDPDRIDEIEQLEADVAEKARERYAAKGETFESLGYTPPTFFQSRSGDGGMWPIREAVKWSKTARGGRNYDLELFLPANEEERGCGMWGLCDIESTEQ